AVISKSDQAELVKEDLVESIKAFLDFHTGRRNPEGILMKNEQIERLIQRSNPAEAKLAINKVIGSFKGYFDWCFEKGSDEWIKRKRIVIKRILDMFEVLIKGVSDLLVASPDLLQEAAIEIKPLARQKTFLGRQNKTVPDSIIDYINDNLGMSSASQSSP